MISDYYYDLSGLVLCDYKSISPDEVKLPNSYDIKKFVEANKIKGYRVAIERYEAWTIVDMDRQINDSTYYFAISGDQTEGYHMRIGQIVNACTKPNKIIRSELKTILSDFGLENEWIGSVSFSQVARGGGFIL